MSKLEISILLRLLRPFVIFQFVLLVLYCIHLPVPSVRDHLPGLSSEVWRDVMAAREDGGRPIYDDDDDAEFDHNTTLHSLWLSKAPCPGNDFSTGQCVPFGQRQLPKECAVARGGGNPPTNTSRWIILAGDSNMRGVYDSMQHQIGIPKVLGRGQYNDRESFSNASSMRFSYRFVDYREQSQGCDDCNANTSRMDVMLRRPTVPHSENGTELSLPLYMKKWTKEARPDIVIMNTGLWEVINIEDEEWTTVMQSRLRARTRALLRRWKTERISQTLIWITTPSARPKDDVRKKTMTRDRLRWLGAMEVKIILEEFPWVHVIDNWSWTDRENFTGSDYHYQGCSKNVIVPLLMQAIGVESHF